MINILGALDLRSGQYTPDPVQMESLRRENPLQAAVFLVQEGKTDEAKALIEEAHRRLKEEVEGLMEEKYQAELNALRDQLEEMAKQRRLDQEELAKLQPLLNPPFTRAVLIEAFQLPLTDDEQIAQLRVAILALETLEPMLDKATLDQVLPRLREELAALEAAAAEEEGIPRESQERRPPRKTAEQEGNPKPVMPYRAVIAVGSGRHEVNIYTHEPLPPAESLRGRTVWTAGDALNVVKIGEGYPTGVAAEVVKRLDDERLHVKGRADEEFVVHMSPGLAAIEELDAGDIVRILPQAELGLDLLEKATKKLTLDELPTETYDDIGGLDEQIAEIRRAIELPFLYRTVYRRYDLRRPKGILLYGPPGCGKTMVAKAIARSLYEQTERALKQLEMALTAWIALDEGATIADALNQALSGPATDGELEELVDPETVLPTELPIAGSMSDAEARSVVEDFLNERQIDVAGARGELRRIQNRLQEGAGSYFLSIKGPELLSKWVGEAEYSIRRIFNTAREKASQETPVVLFFDEIESMFSRRGSGRSSDMEKTIVPQLLAEIDGVDALPNVLVIGASNRYDLIDPAVLRPGRLDIKIRIDRPNKSAARDIMDKYLTANLPIDEKETDSRVNPEQAVRSLISRAVNAIYHPDSHILIYERSGKTSTIRRSGTRSMHKPLTEVVSGAMLANIVERAKRNAAEREVNGYGTGISWRDDLQPAIRQECEESKDQYIFEVRGGVHEMAYMDADLFEADVILREDITEDERGARWARFKTRPWITSPYRWPE